MYDCDVVYIQGNPNSGLLSQHQAMESAVLKLIDTYSYIIVDSVGNNNNKNKLLPNARVYIGFSRGSRYLNKLHKSKLKLSIGGITGSGVNQFIHEKDKTLLGDLSLNSLDAHFSIEEAHKIKIAHLIKTFLVNPIV